MGTRTKKEVREKVGPIVVDYDYICVKDRWQVQAEATDKLKEIAIKHGFVAGKW